MPFIALGQVFYPPRYPARTPARDVIVAEGGHLLGVNMGYGGRGITSDLYFFFILLCTCQVLYHDHVYFRISTKINFLFSQKENSSTRALSLELHQHPLSLLACFLSPQPVRGRGPGNRGIREMWQKWGALGGGVENGKESY